MFYKLSTKKVLIENKSNKSMQWYLAEIRIEVIKVILRKR